MIGIDIGTSYIKVCKIINNGSKRSSSLEDVEEQEDNRKQVSVIAAMKNVMDLEDNEKSEILSSILKDCDISKDSAFLAVGGADLIDKNINLVNEEEDAPSEEVKQNAINEFNNAMREEGEAMYTTHMFIKGEDKKTTNIICTAAPKQIIDSKINIASVGNIVVKGVTMETLALTNAFEQFGPSYRDKENVALLNIGNDVTNIVILKGGKLVFFKDIDFGGHTITKEIASTYMVKEVLAEEIKMNKELKNKINFFMPNVLKKTTSSLIENIFTSIEYCVNKQFVISVDRIVVTGGGCLTDGLDSFIEKTMGITTSKWNPLEDNNFIGYSNKDLGYFLPVALGLALEKEKK
ncbi:MAG: pilus assembly protein PilM [Elusimicrobia bacterium]|nr:pilus assembly protein PilM [Elusimicrobiota bacterium]